MDYVINWVWQGCLVAAMTTAILPLMERTRAQARYAVCWLAMAAITLLPSLAAGFGGPAAVSAAPFDDTAIAPVLAVPAAWWTSTTTAALAGALWLVCASWHLARSLRAARRVRAACTPVAPQLESQLRCWSGVKAEARQAALMISPDVRAASVLGGGRPVIALAPALIERLTPD